MNYGREAENFVRDQFDSADFNNVAQYIDSYYDFKFNDHKVEIKSCSFRIKNGKDRQDFGRFDFTNPKNTTKQRTKDVWVVFVVYFTNEDFKPVFEIVGVKKARSLKVKRYVRLHELMNQRLMSFEKFIKRVSKNGNINKFK